MLAKAQKHQKTPWAAKTNLKRSTFGRPCFNSFNHVFNCHAVCACVGDTTLPPPQGKCVCVRWRYNPPPPQGKCVCVRWQYNPPPNPRNLYVSIQPRHAMVRNRTCPRNLYVSIQPRHAMVRNRNCPRNLYVSIQGMRWFEIERTLTRHSNALSNLGLSTQKQSRQIVETANSPVSGKNRRPA